MTLVKCNICYALTAYPFELIYHFKHGTTSMNLCATCFHHKFGKVWFRDRFTNCEHCGIKANMSSCISIVNTMSLLEDEHPLRATYHVSCFLEMCTKPFIDKYFSEIKHRHTQGLTG
jgi:hypothetical protein